MTPTYRQPGALWDRLRSIAMLTVRIGADHPHHAQLVTEVDRLERLVTDVLSVGIDVRPGPDPEDG